MAVAALILGVVIGRYTVPVAQPGPRLPGVSTTPRPVSKPPLIAPAAWTQQLPAGPMREQALQSIISSLADKDPQSAIAFVQNLPTGRTRQNCYWPIFSRWTAADPAAAAAAAGQLPAGSTRESA